MKIVAGLISFIFVALAAVHIFWDAITIDAISIVLMVIASLPWIFPYLKSLELPGGIKIELKDIQKAVEQVSENNNLEPSVSENDEYDYLQTIAQHDPNLALVAIRIEIEKSVRAVNDESHKHVPLKRALSELVAKQVLSPNVANGLNDFIMLGNHAAHGVEVEPAAVEYAIENAAKFLKPFKEQLAKAA